MPKSWPNGRLPLMFEPHLRPGNRSSPGRFAREAATVSKESVDAGPLVVAAKALETALRTSAASDVPRLAAILLESCGGEGARTKPLFAALFNHVALTPYTRFADNLVALLAQLADMPAAGVALVADVAGYMLRHLVRHLTAFDLRTFHNRGANYPDALLLDTLLKTCLELIHRDIGPFAAATSDDAAATAAKRRRRRALRQAWIVRKLCEGLKVPRTPTSPGDLQRVLPSELAGAAEEEVFDPAKRRKTLFAGDPIERRLTPAVRAVLEQGMNDLNHALELRELGMATFLDRPLGIAKGPAEIDRTPLLTYEAFSRGIARERLAALCRWGLLSEARRDHLTSQLDTLAIGGFTGHHGRLPARPGSPCLEDANLAAPDFVFLRTTRSSLDEFLACFDWSALGRERPEEFAWLMRDRRALLIRVAAEVPPNGEPLLAALDASGEIHWNLCLSASGVRIPYVEEDGRECVAGGLVLKLADPTAESCADAGPTPIAVPSARRAS